MRPRRGAQAVEFALALPMLLTLGLGAIEYGWYFNQANQVVIAARNGARAGALEPMDSAETAAASVCSTNLVNAGVTALTNGCTATLVGDAPDIVVEVRAQVPYAGLASFVPKPAQLVYTASMRLEDQ